jgi:hypothetical protein
MGEGLWKRGHLVGSSGGSSAVVLEQGQLPREAEGDLISPSPLGPCSSLLSVLVFLTSCPLEACLLTLAGA